MLWCRDNIVPGYACRNFSVKDTAISHHTSETHHGQNIAHTTYEVLTDAPGEDRDSYVEGRGYQYEFYNMVEYESCEFD